MSARTTTDPASAAIDPIPTAQADIPPVSLVVFDMHNTLTDHWGRWAKATLGVLRQVSEARNVPLDHVLADARAQSPSDRFHHFDNLLGNLASVRLSKREKHDYTTRWRRIFAEHTEAYPDALSTVHRLKALGVRVAIYSDAPAEEVERDFLQLGLRRQDIDGVFTQHRTVRNGIAATARLDELAGKLYDQLPPRPGEPADGASKKPNPHAMRYIAEHMGVPLSQVLMVDDNANGGVDLPPGVRFAVQKAGNRLDAETIWLHNERLNDPGYVIGWEATSAKLAARGVVPDAVLERGVSDILTAFRFAPATGPVIPSDTVMAANDPGPRPEKPARTANPRRLKR